MHRIGIPCTIRQGLRKRCQFYDCNSFWERCNCQRSVPQKNECGMVKRHPNRKVWFLCWTLTHHKILEKQEWFGMTLALQPWSVLLQTVVVDSSPVAVTKTSSIAPVSSNEFLDIEVTIWWRFTLKRVRDMIITYIENFLSLQEAVTSILLNTFCISLRWNCIKMHWNRISCMKIVTVFLPECTTRTTCCFWQNYWF